MIVLTEKQQAFANEHHDMIQRFLSRRRLSKDEYYDVVVFGYLCAVRNYLERPDLRQYEFSTIAWNTMRSTLSNHYRYLQAAKRRGTTLSLDETIKDTDTLTRGETIATSDSYEDEIDDKLFWLEVSSMLTKKQWQILKRKSEGASDQVIAVECGIPHEKVASIFEALSELLRKMYLGLL